LFTIAVPFEGSRDRLLVIEECSNVFFVDNCSGLSVTEYCTDGSVVVVEECSNRLLAENCCVGSLTVEYCNDGSAVTEDGISSPLPVENSFVVYVSLAILLPLKLSLLLATTSTSKVCILYKHLKQF
jgi:hypothetical protein